MMNTQQRNPNSLSYHEWVAYIKNEVKQMRELDSSEIIKPFSPRLEIGVLNPPNVLKTDFKTLLNKNS